MAPLSKADTTSPLHRWIDRIGARSIWSTSNDRGKILTTAYIVNGRTFIVVITQTARGTITGWDIYVPASEKNSIAATLDSAAIALGVEGCAGLVPTE